MQEQSGTTKAVGRERTSGGTFAKGHKSTGGRPKGSKNSITLLKEAIISKSEDQILKHFPKIVEAVCVRAAKGDMVAARLVFDRILPSKKAIEHRDYTKSGGGIKIIVQGMELKAKEEVIDGEFTEED